MLPTNPVNSSTQSFPEPAPHDATTRSQGALPPIWIRLPDLTGTVSCQNDDRSERSVKANRKKPQWQRPQWQWPRLLLWGSGTIVVISCYWLMSGTPEGSPSPMDHPPGSTWKATQTAENWPSSPLESPEFEGVTEWLPFLDSHFPDDHAALAQDILAQDVQHNGAAMAIEETPPALGWDAGEARRSNQSSGVDDRRQKDRLDSRSEQLHATRRHRGNSEGVAQHTSGGQRQRTASQVEMKDTPEVPAVAELVGKVYSTKSRKKL